jgi:hypothetical protein
MSSPEARGTHDFKRTLDGIGGFTSRQTGFLSDDLKTSGFLLWGRILLNEPAIV